MNMNMNMDRHMGGDITKLDGPVSGVLKFFDERASSYAQIRSHDPYYREFESLVLGLIPREQQQILDIGCGTGDLSLKLAQADHCVVGIDISGEMIGVARERVSNAVADKIRFKKCDVRDLRGQGQFDTIVCLGVLEYVTALEDFVTSIERLLRPQGLLVIQTPNGRSLNEKLNSLAFWVNCRIGRARKLPIYRQTLSLNQIKYLLGERGFKIEHSRYCNFEVFPLNRVNPQVHRKFMSRVANRNLDFWGEILGSNLVLSARRA
jgi:2-polyprenyl-3-methyl-5-hydroxy-6-metoxy-1,4-benzoquinol methylase